jgi:hypothetical protein
MMDLSETSHASYGIANNKPNGRIGCELAPDCELVVEDPQGHHTFQANADMRKAILSLLAAL